MKEAIIIGIILILLIGVFRPDKYEGLTAEEWADEYYAVEEELQDLKYCVSDYPHNAEWECL